MSLLGSYTSLAVGVVEGQREPGVRQVEGHDPQGQAGKHDAHTLAGLYRDYIGVI